MWDWFNNCSVDGILGEFHSLIGRLESAVDFHFGQAELHAQERKKHDDLVVFANTEAVRAQSVANKLKELVG